MKKIVAIILVAAFAFHLFSKLILVVSYEINKEYITKTHCENVGKPKLQCHGKCHLAKQLNKEEKREQSPSNTFKEAFEILLFSEEHLSTIYHFSEHRLQHHSTYLLIPYSTSLLNIEHPPCC